MKLTALLLTIAATFPVSPAGSSETGEWLLVRGDPPRIGNLTYERIGDLYLGGAPYRVVRARDAGGDPDAGRFVIGTPGDNELVAELAPVLGLDVSGDAIEYAGRRWTAGSGLVLVTEDTDGAGRLILMTGVDAAGVYACFTTNVDVSRRGWVMIRDRRTVASGSPPLRIEDGEPLLVRLDRDAVYLVGAAAGLADDEAALRVGRGLLGYADVLVGATPPDLADYGRWLLGPGRGVVAATDAFFAGRDLEAEVRAAHALCVERLGGRRGPAPAYHLLYGLPDYTNASTQDPDPVTGRPRVRLNLCALARARHFDSALLHETVHTLQALGGRTLLERSMQEGVATFVTQELDPTLGDADALLWSAEDLRAAERHRRAIVAAFERHRDAVDPAITGQFLVLGTPLGEVEGAPSRTGYYVAWLACRAWRKAHPDRPLAELLTADPRDVLAAL